MVWAGATVEVATVRRTAVKASFIKPPSPLPMNGRSKMGEVPWWKCALGGRGGVGGITSLGKPGNMGKKMRFSWGNLGKVAGGTPALQDRVGFDFDEGFGGDEVGR